MSGYDDTDADGLLFVGLIYLNLLPGKLIGMVVATHVVIRLRISYISVLQALL